MLSKTSPRPVLALLCGLLCDDEIWREVIAALTTGVDVKVFSFPGFSSIADMAGHVLAAVPGHFAVAGHSMGGRVALEIVRRSEERVTGIALLNTGVHPPAAHEAASRGRLVNLARDAGMTALEAHWLPPMLNQTAPVRPELQRRLAAMIERYSPDSFAAQIRALLTRADAAPILAGLRIPALLLSATGDTWSPPAQHEAMRELCPRAELIIVPEAGHMLPIEQPVAVAAALDRWLARVGRDDWRRAAGKPHVAAMPEAADVAARSDGTATPNSADVAGMPDATDADIVRACTQQIHRYAQLTDAAAVADLCQMFTEDAVFARPSDPHNPIHGRAAIRASLEARPPRRTLHVTFNVTVVVESSTCVRATSDVILITADSAAAAAPILTRFDGSFTDVLHRVGNEWLFASRRGTINSKSVL
jgi:pimeloyl-ACP methyl ester carboxylesterase/ketosteroid isomerase-like protein